MAGRERRGRVRDTQTQGNVDTSGSFMRRGADARAQSHAEQEEARRRAEQRKQGTAFRFFMKPGEEKEVIILDRNFADIPFFYEHTLKGPDGKYNVHEVCVKEMADCPLCQGYGSGGDPKPPSYIMFLSVIDPTGFKTKRGEEVPYDRKLLAVKQGQHDDFFRLFDLAVGEAGTIRGMSLSMARDGGDKSPAIGKPVMFEGPDGKPVMYEVLSEEDLGEEFGHDAILDSNGKELMAADAKLQPFEYEKLFPVPDPDALRRRYGAAATPGSVSDNDGWEDDAGAEAQAPSARHRRRTGTQEMQEDEHGQDPAHQAPARRTRRAATPEPTGNPPAGRRTRGRSSF